MRNDEPITLYLREALTDEERETRRATLAKAETQARVERVLKDAVVDLVAEGYDQDDVDGVVSDAFEEIDEVGQ